MAHDTLARPASELVQPLFEDVDGNGTEAAVLYAYGCGEAYVAFSTGTSVREPVLYSIGLPSLDRPIFEASLAELSGDGKVDIVVINHGIDDVPGAATAVVARRQHRRRLPVPTRERLGRELLREVTALPHRGYQRRWP